MVFVYPAIFKKAEDGLYKGTCPDLEGSYGEGETLDEAIEKCNESVYDWIYLELDEGGILPGVSDPEDFKLKEGDIVRNISVNIRFTEGWDE